MPCDFLSCDFLSIYSDIVCLKLLENKGFFPWRKILVRYYSDVQQLFCHGPSLSGKTAVGCQSNLGLEKSQIEKKWLKIIPKKTTFFFKQCSLSSNCAWIQTEKHSFKHFSCLKWLYVQIWGSIYVSLLTIRVFISNEGLPLSWKRVFKFMVYYKFPNLKKMTHIFLIKKGRGSFEIKQQYHWFTVFHTCIRVRTWGRDLHGWKLNHGGTFTIINCIYAVQCSAIESISFLHIRIGEHANSLLI